MDPEKINPYEQRGHTEDAAAHMCSMLIPLSRSDGSAMLCVECARPTVEHGDMVGVTLDVVTHFMERCCRSVGKFLLLLNKKG